MILPFHKSTIDAVDRANKRMIRIAVAMGVFYEYFKFDWHQLSWNFQVLFPNLNKENLINEDYSSLIT